MATLHTSDTDVQAIGDNFEGGGNRKRIRHLPTRGRSNRSGECGEGAGERSSHVVDQFRNALGWASPPIRHGHEYVANGSRVQRHQAFNEHVGTLGLDAVRLTVLRQEVLQVVSDNGGSADEDGGGQDVTVARVIGHGCL